MSEQEHELTAELGETSRSVETNVHVTLHRDGNGGLCVGSIVATLIACAALVLAATAFVGGL